MGAVFLFALFLGLMSFLILPPFPPSIFSGIARVAMETGAGIRDHWGLCAGAFGILLVVTGAGYADRLLKPLTAISLMALAFFLVATWWTLRTAPVGSLLRM